MQEALKKLFENEIKYINKKSNLLKKCALQMYKKGRIYLEKD